MFDPIANLSVNIPGWRVQQISEDSRGWHVYLQRYFDNNFSAWNEWTNERSDIVVAEGVNLKSTFNKAVSDALVLEEAHAQFQLIKPNP